MEVADSVRAVIGRRRAFGRGWRGLTMTADGLRHLRDLRRSLLDPPTPLRLPAATVAQPADHPQTVSGTA